MSDTNATRETASVIAVAVVVSALLIAAGTSRCPAGPKSRQNLFQLQSNLKISEIDL